MYMDSRKFVLEMNKWYIWYMDIVLDRLHEVVSNSEKETYTKEDVFLYFYATEYVR